MRGTVSLTAAQQWGRGVGQSYALAYGNPGTATHTAVLVPGVGSSLDSATQNTKSARSIFQTVQQQYPGTSQAVIIYDGYEAPAVGDPAMLGADRAMASAPLLDTFLHGLQASQRVSGDQVTVIGHSYGSAVAAQAAHDDPHFAASNVVLVGSPGTGPGIEHASDLHVGHVYAASNPLDEVAGLRRPGPDPINPIARWGSNYGPEPTDQRFGAISFHTGPPYDDGGGLLHHEYFQPKSRSLLNIAAIIAGHPGDVS